MTSFLPLSSKLTAALSTIAPIDGGGVAYRPCAALGRDGLWREAVYFAEATSWFRVWGVWPGDDGGKREMRLEDVVDVRESQLRLPAKFAARLYAAGESGMGYTMFELGYSDGSRSAHLSGNAVDFVNLPEGKGPEDVTAVFPHAGKGSLHVEGVDYLWCLYQQAPRA